MPWQQYMAICDDDDYDDDDDGFGFWILLAIAFASAGPKNKTPKQPQHNKRDKRNAHT